MDRLLINYLPPVIKSVREINSVMSTEQPEVSSAWDGVTSVLNDQFIQDATENGVRRWEKILKLFPKATETMEYRKFRILLKLNEKLPYTIRMLKQMLDTLCGEDGYYMDLQHEKYMLIVKIHVTNQDKQPEIRRLLRRIVPANMGFLAILLLPSTARIYTAMHHTIATTIAVAPYLLHDISTVNMPVIRGYVKCGMRLQISAGKEQK